MSEQNTNQNIDEELIDFACAKQLSKNVDKYYARKSSLKLKANVTEVYTRQDIDEKLSKIGAKDAYSVSDADAKFATKEDLGKISGTQGAKGDKGDPGENGKSAYDIARENGFSGSEQDWLKSLKGEKGDAGTVDTSTFVQKNDLTSYVKSSDLPDMSGYAKKEDIPKQQSLSELGGVTHADVETILYGKKYMSSDAIKAYVTNAINEALKNKDQGNTDKPSTGDNTGGNTGTTTDSDDKWAYQKLFVLPCNCKMVSKDINQFFGDTFECDDLIGAGEDMKNTKVEVRFLGTLQENNEGPAYLINSRDEAVAYSLDYTKEYKDGLRCPMRGMDEEKDREFEKIVEAHHTSTVGYMDYDGDKLMQATLSNAGCSELYMIRRIKEGVIPECIVAEPISQG